MQMIGDRDLKIMFNVTQTDLFFKCTPNQTLAFSGKSVSWIHYG